MSAIAARRRSRTITALVAGLLVLGAAPALGIAGIRTLQNSKEGKAVVALPTREFPATPTAMLATVNDQQLVTSISVMVLAAGGCGGTIVTLPANTDRSQSSDEPHLPVSDSLINSGPEGLVSDIESIAYVSLGTAQVADASTVAELLAPLGPLQVALSSDVVNSEADGNSRTLFPKGTLEMSADQAASVLVAHDAGSTEPAHRPNVRAVWNAVGKSIDKGRDVGTLPEGEPTSMADFMTRMYCGPVQVYNELNTRLLAGAQNPDDRDVGELDASEVILVMAGLAPTAMAAPFLNPSFRLESGFTKQDLEGLAMTGADVERNFVQRVLFHHGNVLSIAGEIDTIPDGKVPDTTVIYIANELQAADARAFAILFGDVEYRQPAYGYPLVDVTVVLGRSYLELLKQ